MDANNSSFHEFGYMTSQATIPNKRDKPGWLAEHLKHIELSKNPKVGRVLVIGDDSIGALPNFPQIWSKYLAPLLTLNYGLYGDQTQHVLWRVQNGLVPLNVEIIVIYVGGNNLSQHSAKDIANGIACIASVLRGKKLNVKIVICGLLPIYNNMYLTTNNKKAKNVNKYLKLFCKKGGISDCYYLKPDDDWLNKDGTVKTEYGTGMGTITQDGNEKFCKSIVAFIEIIKVGVKIEISSDSEVEDKEEPPPKPVLRKPQPTLPMPDAMSALQNSVKQKNKNIVLHEMKKSRRTSSSRSLKELPPSPKSKRPISASSVDPRRRIRRKDRSTSSDRHQLSPRKQHRSTSSNRSSSSALKKSPLHRRSHLASSRKGVSRSRSGTRSSSRSISPVFTVKRGPRGTVSPSPARSPSPVLRKTPRKAKEKSKKSPEIFREGIVTSRARAQSRSMSPCRSPEVEGRDTWLQRASERISPEMDDFEVTDCWDPSSGTGCNSPEQQDLESAKESQSTMKMYGLFMQELEEMSNTKELSNNATSDIKVVGS